MVGRALIWLAIICFGVIGSQTNAASKMTISYSDWQLAQDIWGKSLRGAIADFEKLNPDIKVEIEPVALAQRDVKFTTAIRAGQGPDVFALDAYPIKQYIKEGWIKDLTPFIQKEGGQSWLSDFYPTSLIPVKEGDKIFGVPKNMVAMVVLYNSQLFKEAGIKSTPKNWKEFREASKSLTRATKPGGSVDQWGVTLVLAKACFDLRFPSILRGHGGDFLTPDWKHSALNTPQAKEAFNYVTDLILKEKVMPPGVAQVDCMEAMRLISQKKVAMIIDTIWGVNQIDGINPDLKAREVLEMFPIPQSEGATSKPRSTLYEKAIVMNPNTPHPEAAWKLIKYLTDVKRMEKWFLDNDMLSCRKSVNDNFEPIKKSKWARVVRQEIDHAVFNPLIPQWPEIQETFRQNLQSAVSRQKTPEQAITDAHNDIESILSRK